MMNKVGIILAASLLLTTASAHSITINDEYIGANHHGYGDVIGSNRNFNINFMEVDIVGTILNVSINTTFAGKGDNGLFRSSTYGRTGIGYGDLFLSNGWIPNGDGSQNYEHDDASSGNVWSHGFSLDNRWMHESSAGTGALYSMNAGDNHADIDMSDDFLRSGYFRNGQEVAVDRNSASTTALSNDAVWSVSGNTVDFTIDLAGTNLLDGDELALRWGFTCANDVIEGAVPVPANVSTVPVPAAVWLFGSGLLSLGALARRKGRMTN